ncbi:unnamed protein product [Malus baccata var. baccata]
MNLSQNVNFIICYLVWRFTISHLAQLKFILPEVIEITKVLVKDGRTIDIKPDVRVTMNVDAMENGDKLKYEGGGHMHLSRAFCHRLREISKFHHDGYEILEETLPQPFNCAEQYMHPDTIKCDATTDETHLTPSEQSNEDLNSNISEIPDLSLPTETSFEAPIEQLPVITTYLPQSFRRHFFSTNLPSRNVSIPASNLNIICSVEEASIAASSFEALVEQQPTITSHLLPVFLLILFFFE